MHWHVLEIIEPDTANASPARTDAYILLVQGRPALIFRRVYQLQPKASRSAALPGFASCSTFALGCFVVQTYGTSIVSAAAPPHPHGRSYFAINPRLATTSAGRPQSYSTTRDSISSRTPCSR
jgi:hypothetical protein